MICPMDDAVGRFTLPVTDLLEQLVKDNDSDKNIIKRRRKDCGRMVNSSDVDWVPTLKMGAEESHQPVAKTVMEIPYRDHKDHDYCAAPGTPLQT